MTDDFLSGQDILEDTFTIQESDWDWGVTGMFLPEYKFVLISVKDGSTSCHKIYVLTFDGVKP